MREHIHGVAPAPTALRGTRRPGCGVPCAGGACKGHRVGGAGAGGHAGVCKQAGARLAAVAAAARALTCRPNGLRFNGTLPQAAPPAPSRPAPATPLRGMVRAVTRRLLSSQDLRDAMTVAEITEALALHTIKSHDWHIQPCCALTGARTPASVLVLSSQLMAT